MVLFLTLIVSDADLIVEVDIEKNIFKITIINKTEEAE